MSSDPNDFAVLTPGQFLIGRPLQSLPEPDMTDKLDKRLSQWQKLTKFVQFIWRKWRLDYLNNLQARHKWQFEKENVIPNSMVILKDENLPQCKWTMGRILEIVKGSDGKDCAPYYYHKDVTSYHNIETPVWFDCEVVIQWPPRSQIFTAKFHYMRFCNG
ncbi:uncharacterized protein TNCV_4938381 [Trichonephila clavipes]|nr:uncharacterized protein TNCV_4938381 [Trichonephila clavipes]